MQFLHVSLVDSMTVPGVIDDVTNTNITLIGHKIPYRAIILYLSAIKSYIHWCACFLN